MIPPIKAIDTSTERPAHKQDFPQKKNKDDLKVPNFSDMLKKALEKK